MDNSENEKEIDWSKVRNTSDIKQLLKLLGLRVDITKCDQKVIKYLKQ